jgi:hypothetical protein
MTAPANYSSLHRNTVLCIVAFRKSFCKASVKLHRSFTEALQKLHRSFTEALQKLFLKAAIHRTVFLCKLESFAGAVMQVAAPVRFVVGLI